MEEPTTVEGALVKAFLEKKLKIVQRVAPAMAEHDFYFRIEDDEGLIEQHNTLVEIIERLVTVKVCIDETRISGDEFEFEDRIEYEFIGD